MARKSAPASLRPARNKLVSRRFWFAVWAAAVTTAIVMRPVPEAMSVAAILAGIVGGYVVGDTWLKKYLDPNSAYRGEN